MRPRYALAWREAKLRRPAHRTCAKAHKGENAKRLREIVAPYIGLAYCVDPQQLENFHTSRRQVAGNPSHSPAGSLRPRRVELIKPGGVDLLTLGYPHFEPTQTSCEKWPGGSMVSMLNNVWWVWANRAARTNIAASL